MAKYDIENALSDILAIMTSALNDKITEIENEKIAAGMGLTPTLATIRSDAYFLQSWDDKILNRNPAIFYGVEDVPSVVDGGGAIGREYKIFVEVILVDSGQSNDTHKRIFRYTRALEELFTNKRLGGHTAVKVQALRPLSMQVSLDSSDEIKIGGVNLTIALA